ncbi:MAG: Dabb family protein [Pricia sp.]
MKPFHQATLLFVIFLSLTLVSFNWKDFKSDKTEITMQQDSVLRHVVMFKFKEGTSQEEINKVQEAFSALPSKIPQIHSYEWGTNNSPEGLDKGFTHVFFLTFKSEEDRAAYLPHPDHKAFGDVLGPHLDDVLVLDYWSNEA